MKKVIVRLNIGDYAPEVTSLTSPLVERYAAKIGADLFTITERKFPAWDLDYEKLQIHDLFETLNADWILYIDSDALVHPELPDLSVLLPRDTVAHNGSDFGPIRWRYDDAGYFQRDGRHIGSCNWLATAHRWCRDLWHPLEDLTPEQAVANITPVPEELRAPVGAEAKAIVTAAHLVSDYALSRNIARYGLKFTTLGELWTKYNLKPDFFYHEYTSTIPAKAQHLRETITRWKL